MSYSVKNIFINLLSFSLTGKTPDFGKEVFNEETVKKLYAISKAHSLTDVVFCALNKLYPEEVKGKFLSFYNAHIKAASGYERLKFERERIFTELISAKIPFIPLKGERIAKYYPYPEMRISCDVDILLKKKDVKTAVKILTEKLSYKFLKEYFDEKTFISESGELIELHTDLSEGEKRFEKPLGDVFKDAVYSDVYHGELGEEKNFLYYVMHAAKHFKHGGCGARSVADIYLMNVKGAFDKEKVRLMLDEAGILKFYLAVSNLSLCWFDNKEYSETDLMLERYILSGGVYGTRENERLAKKGKSGAGYYFKRIFMPIGHLKSSYKILVKHPYLYPFCLIQRWFSALFGKRRAGAKKEMEYNSNEKKKKQEEIVRLLNDLEL